MFVAPLHSLFPLLRAVSVSYGICAAATFPILSYFSHPLRLSLCSAPLTAARSLHRAVARLLSSRFRAAASCSGCAEMTMDDGSSVVTAPRSGGTLAAVLPRVVGRKSCACTLWLVLGMYALFFASAPYTPTPTCVCAREG